MSPQPKAPEAQAPEAATLNAGDHNPFVHALLEQAKTLSDELRGKGGLYERIAANRETLRQIKTTGLLSTDQAKAIDEFYPPRAAKAEAAAAADPAATS